MSSNSEIQYEAGDMVIIRDASKEHTLFGWGDGMSEYIGTTMTIHSHFHGESGDIGYRMVEDGGRWSWCSQMFSSLVFESGFEIASEKDLIKLLS